MSIIPVRSIPSEKQQAIDGFIIRNLQDFLSGNTLSGDLHRHDFYYILAIQKGTGKHNIDFHSYKVEDFTVFVLRPGQVHQLTLHAKSRGYLMQFNAMFYRPEEYVDREMLRIVRSKSLCQFDKASFKNIFETLTGIFHEYTARREGYVQMIRARLSMFFIEFVRNQKRKSSSQRVDSYVQERLDDFLDLIDENISEKKEVSAYASMLNLSSFQLNAITKSALGKTASQVIDDHVVLEAKRSLLGTSHQVSRIALDLGYDDVSYFIRFFRKRTGYTPEAFRQNFK